MSGYNNISIMRDTHLGNPFSTLEHCNKLSFESYMILRKCIRHLHLLKTMSINECPSCIHCMHSDIHLTMDNLVILTPYI